ncbi:MAG TPA: glycosyltransferase family 4 protein [Candidatus Acidoferrales bacterium]|nr:glycosyltransferase family 4 protein [Candidatus Acidoferrales bacterium]
MSRILFISQNYSTHARRFLAGLVVAGHDVWFLPCETSANEFELRAVPGAVKLLPPLEQNESSSGLTAFLDSYTRMHHVLEDVKPDLVLAGPIQTGGFLAALVDFHPLLIMSWGCDVLSVQRKSQWLSSVTKFTLNRADMILTDCEAVTAAVCVHGSVPRHRIVCFPWGIDIKIFRPDAPALRLRQRFGWEDCRVIVSARSFEPMHGTMLFLEAMRQVLDCRSDARVLMLGDGSLRPRVEEFIAERGLRDRILVVGRVPEEMLARYFVEADLYISATQCDGSSVSLLEALGCGLTAIVPDVGGNKEWIVHGQNGWLYPVADVDALAVVTTKALESDIARRKMGLTNVRVVRERANWQRNFNKLLAACDRLVSAYPSREILEYAQLQNR